MAMVLHVIGAISRTQVQRVGLHQTDSLPYRRVIVIGLKNIPHKFTKISIQHFASRMNTDESKIIRCASKRELKKPETSRGFLALHDVEPLPSAEARAHQQSICPRTATECWHQRVNIIPAWLERSSRPLYHISNLFH